DARGGGKPAGGDALPAQSYTLPQHSSRELAGRSGVGERGGLVVGRANPSRLEMAARAVSGAHRSLWIDLPRPTFSEIRSVREGPQARGNVQRRGNSRGVGRVLPAGDVLRRRVHAVLQG